MLGTFLRDEGLTWFNPDTFTRELEAAGCPHDEANERAWLEGKERLVRAIANGEDYAFETTLGATTIPALLQEATSSHDVNVWFCGLSDVDLHIQRVAERVAQGGHDIPEEKIRYRYDRSRQNLIALMPGLGTLHVYDNSAPMEAGLTEPDIVLELENGAVLYPTNAVELATTPPWASPIVERALELYPPAWLEVL